MRGTLIFPCLNCGRDTGCVNRLICVECRRDAASWRIAGRRRLTSLTRKNSARTKLAQT
jgi:hypothetical protein